MKDDSKWTLSRSPFQERLQYLRYAFFSYKGRINRKWFWISRICWFAILLVCYCFIGILFVFAAGTDNIFVWGFPFILSLLILVVLFYTDIAIGVKRLHDTNRSGWNLLWGIIPIFGAIYLLVVCGFFKGNESDNRYGPPPNPPEINR